MWGIGSLNSHGSIKHHEAIKHTAFKIFKGLHVVSKCTHATSHRSQVRIVFFPHPPLYLWKEIGLEDGFPSKFHKSGSIPTSSAKVARYLRLAVSWT